MLVGFIMTRDECSDLKKCIDSIYPLVDEIFVIDGGSIDGTIDYLNSIDKVVLYQYHWDYGDDKMCQNQRNRLLGHIKEYYKGEFDNLWIFMIDSDEILSEDAINFLKGRSFLNDHYMYGRISRANMFNDDIAYRNGSLAVKKEKPSKQEIEEFVKKYPDWQCRLFKYTGVEEYDYAPHEIINSIQLYTEFFEMLGFLIHEKEDSRTYNFEYFQELQRRINGDSPRSFTHRGVFIFSPVYEGSEMKDVIRVTDGINGWMNDSELTWLAEKACQSSTIIEVGTYQGRTTKLLSRVCEGKVYVIEPWFGNQYNSITCSWEWSEDAENSKEIFYHNLKDEVASGKVEVLEMTSEEAIPVLKERGIIADMVFLDGDHSAPVIDHDIKEYLQFVRSGGVFCGHDAQNDFPDVLNALNTNLHGWVQTGAGAIWSRVR